MSFKVAVSTKEDGNMMLGIGTDKEAWTNRREFMQKHGLSTENLVNINLDFDSNDFCRYTDAPHKGGFHTVTTDGVTTTKPLQTLLLTLADCICAVIYDPVNNVMMMSHLGRHSIVQSGAERSIKHLKKHYKCQADKLQVYLTPAAGKSNYPIFAINNKGMKELVVEQLLAAGVSKANIEDVDIDTTTDPNYYSHSQYLLDKDEKGRHIVVAMID